MPVCHVIRLLLNEVFIVFKILIYVQNCPTDVHINNVKELFLVYLVFGLLCSDWNNIITISDRLVAGKTAWARDINNIDVKNHHHNNNNHHHHHRHQHHLQKQQHHHHQIRIRKQHKPFRSSIEILARNHALVCFFFITNSNDITLIAIKS